MSSGQPGLDSETLSPTTKKQSQKMMSKTVIQLSILYLEYLRFRVNLGKSHIKYPGVLFPEKPILFHILSTAQRHGKHLLAFSDGIRPLSPHPHPDHHHQKEKRKKDKQKMAFAANACTRDENDFNRAGRNPTR